MRYDTLTGGDTAADDTAADDTETVLVLVEGARDQRLLVRELGDEYEVAIGSPGDDWEAVDCVVVDDRTLQRVADDLAARRTAAEPMFLPVLVLASSADRAERLLTDSVGDYVDDVVVAPTRGRLLRTRVAALLRARRLSLQLDDERDQYKSLAESAQDAIVVFDADGTVQYANPAVESVFGHEPDTVVESPVTALVAHDDLAELAVTGAVDETLVGLHSDGTSFPVEVSVAAFDHDGGRQYTAIVRNVSEQQEREEALERSRDLLDQTQSIASVGGWEVDPETDALTWTDEAYRIHGVPVGTEMTLEAVLDLYHPDDVPVIRDAVERTLATGEPFDLDLRVQRPDGEKRWIRGRGAATEVDGRTVVRGAVQDITDRVEREQEIRASHERLELALDASEAGIWEMNLETDEVVWHESNERLFGLEPGEFEGTVAASDAFIHPDDLPGLYERMEAAIDRGGQFHLEFRIGRADGEQRWLASSGRVIDDEDGEPERLIGVNVDITELKRRERDLERYETIVRAAADPIYALDSEGTITLANEALAAATGRSVDDLLGMDITELLDPADVESSLEHIAAFTAGEDPEPLHVTLDTPSGPRQYEVNIALQGNDDEGFPGTVGVARDVTGLRQREQRLSVLDRVLRHNIRNRLNVVMGHAGLLTGDDNATVRASAATIVDTCEELLDLSETARRFETALYPAQVVHEPLDLATHLPHVVEEASTTYPEATIDLALEDGGPLQVHAHEALELAIEEVVENAIVHCDRTPAVTISARGCPDDVVELRVADNGPGIDDVERNALTRDLETPLEHMSGLGLWFVRWTIESSGGSLAIEDSEPRGTVVSMRLPWSDAPPE